MNATEILADNLRRLMQGQKSLDWAGDVVTSYHVDQEFIPGCGEVPDRVRAAMEAVE